ncbi:TniQ family protein [uncultured Alteromonas sp.]|uniref:TniQ family protein n=1 Tax=uncultured Alteromonas sp. TaxID=179113 RepID=UPI0030CAAA3B
MLSVLPSQIVDESFISLILRITARNGFTSPYDWMDAKSFDAVTKGKLSNKQHNCLSELIPLPEPNLNIKPNAKHSALFTCTDTESPRVCPQCINDTGYLKKAWRSIGYLYCDRHQLTLIDVCHHCGEKLQWSVALLSNTCTNEYCAKQLTSTPINAEIAELFIDEICDCLLAYLFLTNPFLTYLPHQSYPQFTNLPVTLISGWELLTDKLKFQNFVEQLKGTTSPFATLPIKYQLFPLRLLTRHLKASWPVEQWVDGATERVHCHTTPHSNIDEFIVTVEDAVKLLSIPRTLLANTIPQLSEKKAIPSTLRVNIAHLTSGKK